MMMRPDRSPPIVAGTFSVRGVIRAPYADGEISIQHEAIPDYMPAMTMPFRVDEADCPYHHHFNDPVCLHQPTAKRLGVPL